MFTAAKTDQVDVGTDATNYYCGGQLASQAGATTSGSVRCKLNSVS